MHLYSYGKLNSVEEVAAFAKALGARKVGLATCIGLIREARVFTNYLRSLGIERYSVLGVGHDTLFIRHSQALP